MRTDARLPHRRRFSLNGGSGIDILVLDSAGVANGNGGDDAIFGSPEQDTLTGGGADTIHAIDEEEDDVTCGQDDGVTDTVHVDTIDTRHYCGSDDGALDERQPATLQTEGGRFELPRVSPPWRFSRPLP